MISKNFLSGSEKFSLMEHRLCWMAGPEMPKGYAERAKDWIVDGVESVAKKGGYYTTEVTKFVSETVIGVPKGFIKGIIDSWNRKSPSQEEYIKTLNQVSQFAKDFPEIGVLFADEKNPPSMATIMKLTEHSEWINAFEQKDMLTTAGRSILVPGSEYGPNELLSSLPLEKRKELYVKYVDAFIPEGIQNKIGVDTSKPDFVDRFNAMGDKKDTLNLAMHGMIGEDVPQNDPAHDVAVSSLKSKYGTDHFNAPTRKMMDDYNDAIRYQKMFPLAPSLLTPNTMANELPDSLMKGALNLGIIDQKLLDQLDVNKKQWDMERTQALTHANQGFNRLSGSVDNKLSKAAETLHDRWDKLGGLEKLLLIGALLWGVTKSKTIRYAAVGLTAAFFGQKLLMKNDDPIGTWSKWIGGGFDFLKEKNAKVFGDGTVNGNRVKPANESGDVDLMVNFLSGHDRHKLESQAMGFSLIGEVPMSILANDFMTTHREVAPWMMQLGSPLDKTMKANMKKNGWNMDYGAFLVDNRLPLSEALGFVFYEKAKENPGNAKAVGKIERLLAKLPDGSSIARLTDIKTKDPKLQKEIDDADNEYVRLVNQGQSEFMHDDRTLSEYLRSLVKPGLRPLRERISTGTDAVNPQLDDNATVINPDVADPDHPNVVNPDPDVDTNPDSVNPDIVPDSINPNNPAISDPDFSLPNNPS